MFFFYYLSALEGRKVEVGLRCQQNIYFIAIIFVKMFQYHELLILNFSFLYNTLK